MEKTKWTLAEVQSLLDYRDYRSLRVFLKDNEIADIAEIFVDLDQTSRLVCFRLLPRDRRVDLFSVLSIEWQEILIDELPELGVSAILNEMEPDKRTRLLEELPAELQHKILLQLNPEERRVAWRLLSYPEDSVGRLMTPDLLALNEDMSVAQAIEQIHWSTKLPLEHLSHLFVINSAGQLIGEVSLSALVVCDPPTMPVAEVMKKNYIFLEPEQEASEALSTFRKYESLYIPVIDADRQLLGMVTSDDLFDLAEEEATEDIQQFGGHAALEESYFQTPFWTMWRKRAGWLAFLFFTGFLSGEAIRNYEDLLSKWGFLIFFLTTLNSAGGNAGTQTASLIIRGMALNEIRLLDVGRVLLKEVLIGLSLGGALAGIGAVRALTWGLGMKVAIVIAIVVLALVLFGVMVGSMLPFLFRSLRLDPAVVSSPFISTVMDLSGVVFLFAVAGWMARFFGFP